MKMKSGFTLLEMLIVIAVIATVVAIGVPAMGTFIQNDRLTTQINTLVGHLSLARSEAVKRAQGVAVCVSNNTTSCTGTNNWAQGWIVYVDVNGNGARDGGEEILRVKQALEGGNTLKPATIGSQVTYDYRGFASGASVGSFSLCDSRGATYGKAIAISNTGRVRKESSVSC